MTGPAPMPCRIQRKRTKGFRLQDASPNGLPVVYVGRPTKWGNPYTGTAIGDFRVWAINSLHTDLHELRGKNLACWCPLDQPCHADVLLELANS